MIGKKSLNQYIIELHNKDIDTLKNISETLKFEILMSNTDEITV